MFQISHSQMFQLPQPLLNPEVIQSCGFSVIITRLISVGHPAWCLSAELAEGRMSLLFFLWQIPSSLASATWNQVLTLILGGMWNIHGTFLAPSPSLNDYFRGIKIKILLEKHCAICAVEASLKAFSKPFLVKGNFTEKMSSSDLKSRKNHFLLQATGNDFFSFGANWRASGFWGTAAFLPQGYIITWDIC